MATDETPPPRRICATCDWWDIDGILIVRGDVDGTPAECRRHPPKGQAHWPMTYSQGWCGEWQPRKKDRGGEHE